MDALDTLGVVLVCSPWILGFMAAVLYSMKLLGNKNGGNPEELESWLKAVCDKTPTILKIPLALLFWAASQGFLLGMLFVYVFFCPDDAAIL